MNPLWAIVAMAALYGFISRSEIVCRWGDVTSGVAFERARKALLKLEDEKYHPKNWRPSILALSGGACGDGGYLVARAEARGPRPSDGPPLGTEP